MVGQGYFTRGFYYLSELRWWTERAGDDQTGHPSRIGVILPEAVLMDAIQWRTDRSDRPVRTNGKRPNYQQIFINLPMSSRILLDDWDYQAFVLTISSQERVLENPVELDNREGTWNGRKQWIFQRTEEHKHSAIGKHLHDTHNLFGNNLPFLRNIEGNLNA